MPVIPGCQHRGMEYCSGELMRGFTAWSFVQHCRWEEFFVLINNPALPLSSFILNFNIWLLNIAFSPFSNFEILPVWQIFVTEFFIGRTKLVAIRTKTFPWNIPTKFGETSSLLPKYSCCPSVTKHRFPQIQSRYMYIVLIEDCNGTSLISIYVHYDGRASEHISQHALVWLVLTT